MMTVCDKKSAVRIGRTYVWFRSSSPLGRIDVREDQNWSKMNFYYSILRLASLELTNLAKNWKMRIFQIAQYLGNLILGVLGLSENLLLLANFLI